jgi:hypothetical protein
MSNSEASSGPVDQFKAFFESHGHPNCMKLFGVLLVLTLVEIGWASTLPFVDYHLKDAQVFDQDAGDEAGAGSDWGLLCKAIVADEAADRRAVRNAELAAALPAADANKDGALSAEELAKAPTLAAMDTNGDGSVAKEEVPTPEEQAQIGRPGTRIFTLVSSATSALIHKGASGELSGDEAGKLREGLNSGLVDNLALFHPRAFASLEVGEAIKHKLGKLRSQSASKEALMTFLGEADVAMLNRSLLRTAYPKIIAPMSASKSLIACLILFAVIKALFVAEYFMHVKYEGNWVRVLMVPTMCMVVVVLCFLLPDVGGLSASQAETTWLALGPTTMALAVVLAGFVVKKLTSTMDFSGSKASAASH